jgi:hypothetical protein
MSRPAARDRRPPPVPLDVHPWALRNAIEVPETANCATCRRDVSFLVLDNRDMKWRCTACATPVAESPAEARLD